METFERCGIKYQAADIESRIFKCHGCAFRNDFVQCQLAAPCGKNDRQDGRDIVWKFSAPIAAHPAGTGEAQDTNERGE